MTFDEEILDQAIAILQRRGRVTYRLLKRQFQLDDDTLADLLAELRYAHRDVISEDEQGMVWTGGAAVLPTPPPPALQPFQPSVSQEAPAATSLSRLWQQQGKQAAAHELLAPIYGWFTEGFDTADLQEAKALLAELE